MKYDFANAKAQILKWKSHIVKSIAQEKSKKDVLSFITEDDVFVTMDWAMKYVPHIYHEKQSDFFGKRGIPWHAIVMVVKSGQSLASTTFFHITEGVIQDWFSVLCILEHALKKIKMEMPRLKHAYIRSDNAGCYHCGPLLLAYRSLGERTGINIKRVDFSEAQCGKDVCDRQIGVTKLHMARYVSAGNDIKSGLEMKKAIESFGGVSAVNVCVVQPDVSLKSTEACMFPKIASHYNFLYTRHGIRMWRQCDVGAGKLLQNRELDKFMKNPQRETELQIFSDVTDLKIVHVNQQTAHTPQGNRQHNDERSHDDPDDCPDVDSHHIWRCSVEGCHKSYM